MTCSLRLMSLALLLAGLWLATSSVAVDLDALMLHPVRCDRVPIVSSADDAAFWEPMKKPLEPVVATGFIPVLSALRPSTEPEFIAAGSCSRWRDDGI